MKTQFTQRWHKKKLTKLNCRQHEITTKKGGSKTYVVAGVFFWCGMSWYLKLEKKYVNIWKKSKWKHCPIFWREQKGHITQECP